MAFTSVSRSKCFGGVQGVYSHESRETACLMRFGVFLPPQAESQRVPVLYWLSGLTCTEENFMAKAGAQRWAAETGILLVAPDTSPRNTVIEGEASDWEVGSGAGFYVNAITEPWKKHFQMFDYVAKELPAV